MDLRTHYPYSLLQHGLVGTYPSLARNLTTDVAVIGAGITGALVAWHLQEKGIPCVVADRRHVAMGSTAASTSLIQYEIDVPLRRLIPMVGYRNAVRSYELCRQAIGDLKKISRSVGNGKNFQEKHSLQFASYQKDAAGLEQEYAWRKKLGFRVDLLSAADVKKHVGFDAPAALLSYEAAQLDAYLFTHKLLGDLRDEQCPVYDHTEIVAVRHEKRKVVLRTAGGYTITAKKLVVACGFESGKYLGRKVEDLHCTYAIVSEPLPQEELWKDNCLIWETASPYRYIRTTPDHRVLIGGKDTGYHPVARQLALLPQKAKSLRKSFGRLFPHLPFRIDFQWAGAFATTRDGLPYIGTAPGIPHTYFALGYGGNGITFSLLAAQMISGSIHGEPQPDLELFSFGR